MDPGLPREWLQEALARHAEGQHAAALLAYRRLLSRFPEAGELWSNFSALLGDLGRREEALEAAEHAVRLAPELADARANLGKALGGLGRWEAAAQAYREALARGPAHPAAGLNLGAALHHRAAYAEALEATEAALARFPERAAAHLNRAVTLLKLGRLEEAEAGFLEALAREPGSAEAHWNLAFLRLLQGRWAEAWPHYGHRLRLAEARPFLPPFEEPAWAGQAFPGRTLLVWAEQGLGDTLQFVRYLPQAKARGGRVLLQAQAPLLGLLASCEGADEVLGEHEEAPPFDLQVPLLSLPQVLESTLDTLPPGPSLRVPEALEAQPPPALAAALEGGAGRRVGLFWAGNPHQRDDAARSMDPALLAPLAALRGVRWYSLQKAAPGSDPGGLPEAFGAVDLAPYLATFSETAWAMERLDFLVSVDSAPVHLAGSLGLPTACLLAHSPDWRWLWDREDSPWYPSLRLYRQARPGDWEGVVARLLADLA